MKNYHVLALLALFAVLLPVAALADGETVAEGIEIAAEGIEIAAEGIEIAAEGIEIAAETAVSLDDAADLESPDENAEAQVEIIPNSMSWAMGKPGSCGNLCSQCPNETCELACLIDCTDRFSMCNGEACCGLPDLGYPECV